MKRRAFIAAAGALLAPRVAQGQSTTVYRIGFLGTAFESGYVRELGWIREGLRKFGYVEGGNLHIEYRWAEGSIERSRAFAVQFVSMKVNAILVHGLPGAIAATRATSTIPVVMADGADPVAAGIAASIARPGGNLTGSFSFVPEEVGKRLQLLKEVLPRLKKVAFLATPDDAAIVPKRIALVAAVAAEKVELQEFNVREEADLPVAFNAMVRAKVDGVVVNNEPFMNSQASVIASLAALLRLPATAYASYADAGGLLAYGSNRAALYTRAGYFLDRIFKGAKPGEIPLERASKFELIINLKAAKALGLQVPQSLLLRADRVIE